MRRLMILRHAKAEPYASRDDFARELTERGREDAHRMGVWMAETGLRPDWAIYSGAARTRATYEIVAQAMRRPIHAASDNSIYEATWSLIMGLLRELPAEAREVLVVGHNPGMSDLANALTGEGPEMTRLRMAARFPTGALAAIAFDRPDWSGLVARSGRLERFVAPSEIELAGGNPR